MKAAIHKIDPTAEYFFAEGCFINELSNGDNDPALSIAQARVQPGRTTRWHLLAGITERYAIQRGEGLVEVEGLKPEIVTAGDVVLIPPGAKQRICNTGTDDLVFLALCTPRFTEAAYVDVDDSPA